MVTTIEGIQAVKQEPHRSANVAKYTLSGIPVDTGNGFKVHKTNARYIQNCYKNEINRWPSFKENKMPGFGPIVAFTETVAATALVWCFPEQRATKINLATTLGEFVQTFIQGTDMFDSEEVNKKKKELREQKDLDERELIENEIDELSKPVEEGVEQVLSWIQVGAGVFGIGGTAIEKFSSEQHDISNVPIYKRITLGLVSALNAFLMFFGAAEKTLMSSLNENRELDPSFKGIRYKSMEINGDSDLRCSGEWFAMIGISLFSQIGFVKDLCDVLIGYNALREGLDYFVKEKRIGFPKLFEKSLNENDKLYKVLDWISNPIKLNRKKDLMCFPFNFNAVKKWYLGTKSGVNGSGTSGFREKFRYIVEYFGTQLNDCYIDKDGNVTSVIPDKKAA